MANGRKHQRRVRKKALQRGEMILGVPAFHQGGSISHNLTGHLGESSNPFEQVQNLINLPGQAQEAGLFRGQGGGSPPDLVPSNIPGFLWDMSDPDFPRLVRDPSFSPGGPGGGAAGPQFRPGEFQFMQEQFAFEQESFQLDLELRRLTQEQNNAIAQGNLALAKQTEARIAEIQRRQQQLDASLGRAQGIAGLAQSRGQIEAQRASELARLAANPRDFRQLDIALGGGQSAIGNLLGGRPVGGRSTSLIGDTPTLGEDFQRLLQSITARPDIPLFDEAADLFRNVPQFRKGGTKMVTDEPIVGMGLVSRRPRFTLGEPTAEFPEGAPEKMEVTPLAHGGTVKSGQPFNPFSPGTTAEDLIPKPAPTFEEKFGFPSFPGLGGLTDFLFEGSPLQQAQENFGQGTSAGDIGAAAQQFLQSIPRSAGEAIRRLTPKTPQEFFGLLPSDLAVLESLISGLGTPPENFIQSIMRAFPTGPDPSRISFGNFRDGGTIIAGMAARPTINMYRDTAGVYSAA